MVAINKYVLDSSVANLVLDGKLWERCLLPYEVELRAGLFCVEGEEQWKIGDIVPHIQQPRAISTYWWARLAAAGQENKYPIHHTDNCE